MPSITIHGYKHGASVSAPLPDVWVYWKAGGKTTTLRADATGLLMAADVTESAAEPHPAADMPWVYTADFDVVKGSAAEVAFTRGAKPLAPSLLPASRFTKVVVGDPWKEPFHAPENTWAEERWIQIGAPNALGWMFILDILVPDHESTLTGPTELDLWPLLFEFIGERPNSRNYFTDGLPQGASLFTWVTAGTDHGEIVAAAQAGDSAPPPGPDLRPYERALRITGTVESRAETVRIEIVDTAGKVAQPEYGTLVVLEPDSGKTKPFHADIYFEDAAGAFGEVQIAIHAEGMPDPYTDAYFVLLSGLQTALVDDRLANPSGKEPGPVPTEATDLRVVDFTSSPQPTVNQIFTQGRMQRMVEYRIDRDYRAFSATDRTIVDTPQMPLWMAELHLVGAGEKALQRLMRFRQKLRKSQPKQLEFRCEWGLRLWWDGPCADSGAGLHPERNYSYMAANWPDYEQQFVLQIDDKGEWKNLEKAGSLQDGLATDPGPVAFPVAGRRGAKAWVKNRQRRWGRKADAPLQDTVVLEWQPRLTDGAGTEWIRGGNGRLDLRVLEVDAKAVPVGRNWNEAAGATEAAVASPVVRLAPFRIAGVNPAGPPEEMDTIVEAAVREYFAANSGEPHVQALPLAAWAVTLRMLIRHESRGVHFGVLGMDVVSNFGVAPYYGKQRGMPLFGPPHGYGLGQLDNPPVTDDACWSFIGNVKAAVALVMGAKAAEALALFGAGTTDKWRAMFRRECVRRYNGWAPEFKLHGGVWKIDPGVPANARPMANGQPDSRVYYPNDVLQTNTAYYDGNGSQASDYDWPIDFTEADWGPMQ